MVGVIVPRAPVPTGLISFTGPQPCKSRMPWVCRPKGPCEDCDRADTLAQRRQRPTERSYAPAAAWEKGADMSTTTESGATGQETNAIPSDTLSEDELRRMDLWWRAANYLSVGQIYLMDNPLLGEELEAEHVKPRLLGHWGTSPGLNFLYAHLNRAIMQRDLDMIYIIGPGHGGPSLVAAAWLEGTYSE